jgi:hypothetical protein
MLVGRQIAFPPATKTTANGREIQTIAVKSVGRVARTLAARDTATGARLSMGSVKNETPTCRRYLLSAMTLRAAQAVDRAQAVALARDAGRGRKHGGDGLPWGVCVGFSIGIRPRGMPASGSRARGVHVRFTAWWTSKNVVRSKQLSVRLYRTGLIPFQPGLYTAPRILKIGKQRLAHEVSPSPPRIRKNPSKRLVEISLTLGNLAPIFAARTSPTETGLAGWGARTRTWEWRNQNPLPYHLATPQQAAHCHHGARTIAARLGPINGVDAPPLGALPPESKSMARLVAAAMPPRRDGSGRTRGRTRERRMPGGQGSIRCGNRAIHATAAAHHS